MSEKITSTLDPRIAPDVEARNRVQVQMQALLDGDPDKFDAQAEEEAARLEQEFNSYTDRIQTKMSLAAMSADTDFGNAVLEQGRGEADRKLTPHQRDNREPGADEILKQSMLASRGSPESYATVKLRAEVMQSYEQMLSASPTEREARALFQGNAGADSPFMQEVIARITGTNVTTVSDIQPEGVEARYIEVLRNINGPHKCGMEIWYTPDISSRKLPKAYPGGTNPRTTLAAERPGDDAISSANSPFFENSPTTTPREYSALFGVERSAERATPAMVGAKVGELLAREIGEQVAGAASVGRVANTAEGLTPNTAITTAAFPEATGNWPWLHEAGARGQEAALTTWASTPTFDNVLDVMGAKPDFPATGAPMGDVWHIHKQYAFTIMKIKGTDGQPIFRAMGDRGAMPVDTLYGRPIIYSDFLSPTNVANRIVAVFGDFWAGAVCRRGGDVEIATDASVFFDKNQIAYRGLMYEAVVVKNANQFSYAKGS